MLLRAATPADLPAVRKLLTEAKLPTDGLEEQFGPAYVVAVDDAEPLGVAGVERYGRVGLLRSVAVAEQRRGQGLGEKLVRDRIEWARAGQLERLYLLTTTAAAYFPKLGFTETERETLPNELSRSTEVSSICPASAVVMVLALGVTARP